MQRWELRDCSKDITGYSNKEKAHMLVGFFLPQQADKPNSVEGDHLSRPSITLRLKRVTFHQDSA